jgi:hypothetical protein
LTSAFKSIELLKPILVRLAFVWEPVAAIRFSMDSMDLKPAISIRRPLMSLVFKDHPVFHSPGLATGSLSPLIIHR